MILEYIDQTTNCTTFYLREDLASKTGFFGYFFHRVAGFLGVYGNLASCTFLHGTVALFITGKEDFTSVVGDDALVAKILAWAKDLEEGELEEGKTVENAIEALQMIGNIARRKFAILEAPTDDYVDEILDANTWAYLKRSLTRFTDQITLSIQYDIANLALVYKYTDTSRQYGFDDPLKAIATQITALLIKIHSTNPASDETLEIIAIILDKIYRAIGFPRTGLVPGMVFTERVTRRDSGYVLNFREENVISRQVSAFFILPVLPVVPSDFRADPLRVLAETLCDEVYKLPIIKLVEDIPVIDVGRLLVGSVVEGQIVKVSKYLRDFGYIEAEDCFLEQDFPFDSDVVYLVFSRMRSRMYKIVQRYTVLSQIPHVFH